MDYSLTAIICTYNRPEILKTKINSLLKIRHSVFPIEIIVIDDGSKIKLSKDFRKFLIQNKIKLKINSRNLGLAYSRNKGIRESQTKYFLISDDDDIYENPTLLKKLYENVVKEKVDIGIGIPNAQSRFEEKQICSLKTIFLKGVTPPVSYQIYRKDMLENYYDKRIKAGIDMDLWVNLLHKNPTVLLLASCEIKSVKHKENESLTKNYKKRANYLKESMNIWENKIIENLGEGYFSRFKKASIEYELWFRFLSNISDLQFFNALKIFLKSNLIEITYRCLRYVSWKLFKIKMPINSHFINFFKK